MSVFKAKASFFSGSYYKELLRELRIFGIIFAVLQLICGLAGAGGRPLSLGPMSLLMYDVLGSNLNPQHTDVFLLYFFVCGLNFVSTHIWRKNWDFRNCLPIAKRTMFVCHLAAVLTWAVVIFAANYLGAFIGEGIRLITSATSVPDGFGMSAVSMLKAIVQGISIYSLFVIICSVTNRVFAQLAAVGVIIGLPILFNVLQAYQRANGIDTLELLLPIGIGGIIAFKTIFSVLLAIALTVIAYFAFGKSRVETYQKSARAAWINVLIGLGVAACVGIISTLIIYNTEGMLRLGRSEASYENPSWYYSIAYALIPMLIAYFVYMWITERSFVSALKKCAFLPLVLVVFGAATLIALAADKKWEKLDFSYENIECVRIRDEHFIGTSHNGMLAYDGGFSGRVRGRSNAYSVKITDNTIRRLASEHAKISMYEPGSISAALENYLLGILSPNRVEITLKDGTRWSISGGSDLSIDALAGCEEYIEALASLDRFKGAKVIAPMNFGAELNKTLLEELAALEPAERAKLLTDNGGRPSGFYHDYTGITLFEYDDNTWKSDYGYELTLVSPTYDHVAVIELGSSFPKTTELYMKLMNEKTRKHRDYEEFISTLKTAQFWDCHLSTSILKDGKMLSNSIGMDGVQFAGGINGDAAQYKQDVLDLCTFIAECIEQNAPIEGADAVFGLGVGLFTPYVEGKEYWSYSRLFRGNDAKFFVGLDKQKAEKLEQLITSFKEKYMVNYEPSYDMEFTAIEEAVAEGSLKLYDQSGNELTLDDVVRLYKDGYEWFYVENGEQMHIYDIYEMLMKDKEQTL